MNAAVAAARSAKVAVVFADDNGATNSDLVNSLAQNEDTLIEAVASANPHGRDFLIKRPVSQSAIASIPKRA